MARPLLSRVVLKVIWVGGELLNFLLQGVIYGTGAVLVVLIAARATGAIFGAGPELAIQKWGFRIAAIPLILLAVRNLIRWVLVVAGPPLEQKNFAPL